MITINIFDYDDSDENVKEYVEYKEELSEEEMKKKISQKNQLQKQVITIDGKIHPW